MLLAVKNGKAITDIEIAEGEILAYALGTKLHLHLDLRCGGKGLCDRCKIELLDGIFSVDGQEVDATKDNVMVNSCRTKLLSDTGTIAVPDTSLIKPMARIVTDFSTQLEVPPSGVGYKLAIDIGTTTVAVLLLADGKLLANAAMPNMQARYGDNVASRISFASTAAENRLLLQEAIVDDTLNVLISTLPVLPGEIEEIVIAGNPTMMHLLYGVDPVSIGTMPFKPVHSHFPPSNAGTLGLTLNPAIPVLNVPGISGYVGGDIVGGIYLSRIGGTKKCELLIDIGTNCEIVLAKEGKLYCSAAAAGPAFEGAGISHGGRAAPGAIDHISISGDELTCSVIGGLEAESLCGSAMVDFLAAARENGWVNEFGRFDIAKLKNLGRHRMVAGNIHACLIIALPSGFEITVSERDVEQILKAKAAVHAGIISMLEHFGSCRDEVETIYLCGGFAKYLDLVQAQAIAMLPRLTGGKYEICGNTALAGAAQLALKNELLPKYIALAADAVELPLSAISSFEFNYIDSLLLP